MLELGSRTQVLDVHVQSNPKLNKCRVDYGVKSIVNVHTLGR